MVVTLVGIVIVDKRIHPANALVPSRVRVSYDDDDDDSGDDGDDVDDVDDDDDGDHDTNRRDACRNSNRC